MNIFLLEAATFGIDENRLDGLGIALRKLKLLLGRKILVLRNPNDYGIAPGDDHGLGRSSLGSELLDCEVALLLRLARRLGRGNESETKERSDQRELHSRHR